MGGTAIQHPQDTATLEVLVFPDDMVRLRMVRDGQELGRVTVPRAALVWMLNGEEDAW